MLTMHGARWRPLTAVAGLAALALAACSSSGSSAGGGSTSTGSGSASTISVGIITDEGTSVDESWEVAAVQGALIRINASGGIAGHKVKLIVCNEDLDPNKAQACARQLIADHVIAFDGNQPLAAEANVDELMRSAGIANVAPSSYGPTDSDPNSYELYGGQTFVNAAQIMFGEKYAGPKVAVSLLDSPLTTAFIPFYKKALPSLNGALVGTATSSQTATDVSPQAAALVATHPNWIDTNSAPQAVVGIAKDAAALGFTGHIMVSGTELTLAEIQGMGADANHLLFVSPFPPVGDASKYPAIQNFVTDMKAEAATGDSAAPDSAAYVPFLAEDAYFGMIAIANIANQAKATTSAAFKTAISAAKSVSLGTGLPAWDPNKSISKAVPRASTGLFYFSEWSDGKDVLVGSNPVDVTAVANAGTS